MRLVCPGITAGSRGAGMTSIKRDRATQLASATGGASDDRFLWGFPLFALCCEITLFTLTYLERLGAGWLILAGVLFFPVVSLMVVVAAIGVFDVVRERFRRAAALLLAPFIFVSPLVSPIWAFQFRAVELVRLHLNKGHYDAVIEKLPPAERASKV